MTNGGAATGWIVDEKPAVSDRATVLPALKKSEKRVVAVVDEKIEECSSAGGTHVLLKVGADLLHFGGHGVNLQAAPNRGDVLVVAYEPEAKSIEKKAFCVPARNVVGRVTAALPVNDSSEGERVLADLSK